MTVFCQDCANVHSDTRDEKKPWTWRCVKHPHPSGYYFVHPTYAPAPPYHRCKIANRDGRCNLFQPLRKPSDENR